MDRFNSLFVSLLLISFFAVSVSALVSPDDSTTDRNSTTTTTTSSSEEEEDLDHLLKNAEHHFTNFVKKYGRTYADEEEYAYRLSLFKSHLRRAKRNQKLDPTAVHGITQFSDLTLMEFKRNFGGGGGGGGGGVKRVKLLENNFGDNATILPTNDLPADFDWRDRGVVSPAKDQGNCGSDYAFSAIGATESAYAIATNKVLDLSEQEVLDCTYLVYQEDTLNGRFISNNVGCFGGRIEYVLEHLRTNVFMSEAQYPYTSGNGQLGPLICLRNRVSSLTGRVANFSVVNSASEDQIVANLVKNGPLAVVVKMHVEIGRTYVGGVSCPLICPSNFDYHAVVLVGYGAGAYSPIRLKKEPYWILKNSFGKIWGENGFYRTCRSKNVDCGGLMEHVITVACTD